MPQDVRERKGAFFTPQMWVELSQRYIAFALGKNWQDDHVVWDCAAGTGNLLVGLTNKNNIWASTLDKADVDVMHERINHNANLWANQIFQFDFLNDEFLPKSKGGKIPDALFKIINDAQARKKLVIYINPPYAEAATTKAKKGTGKNKPDVAIVHKTNVRYKNFLGKASNELFTQFMARVYNEIPGCVLAEFSKMKTLQAPNFKEFRRNFKAKLVKMFVCPADTFDNVKGQFPIGFKIWNLAKSEIFKQINADVFDAEGTFSGRKMFRDGVDAKYINDWYRQFYDSTGDEIGVLRNIGTDFQNVSGCHISNMDTYNHTSKITARNLMPACVYFAVRKVVPADWLNDRDQFYYPNDSWKDDTEFQNDCLAYSLFHQNNTVQSKHGVNHWIPFTEAEVGSRERFDSHFMTDFIAGAITPEQSNEWFVREPPARYGAPRFSAEAQAVFDAGRALWRYYFQQRNPNTNASWYDIRQHFKGQSEKGGKTRMNAKSMDAGFNELSHILRVAMDTLAKKIEPKVYEHGFLK